MKTTRQPIPVDVEKVAQFILRCQQPDGAIRWYPQHKLDPWDHTEAAMGLCVAGHCDAAKKAYNWLQREQHEDGHWHAAYFACNDPSDADHTAGKVETNFVAYPATGVWHYFRVTGDRQFLHAYFPMVEKAIEFVLRQQHREGDIQWALSHEETLAKDALVTACSSILRSLECALLIADTLQQAKPHWLDGYQRLAQALLHKPWRFDRTWDSKSRYSMDWFYPVLAGLYSTQEAELRLRKRWHEFVEENLGCRCVSDEPWVTVAESCELVMATLAAGQRSQALAVFKWLSQWQDRDGGYWTGYSFRDKVIWPQEKTSWTAAAILLAADALFKLTPAANLFTTPSPITSVRTPCAAIPPTTESDPPG